MYTLRDILQIKSFYYHKAITFTDMIEAFECLGYKNDKSDYELLKEYILENKEDVDRFALLFRLKKRILQEQYEEIMSLTR